MHVTPSTPPHRLFMAYLSMIYFSRYSHAVIAITQGPFFAVGWVAGLTTLFVHKPSPCTYCTGTHVRQQVSSTAAAVAANKAKTTHKKEKGSRYNLVRCCSRKKKKRKKKKKGGERTNKKHAAEEKKISGTPPAPSAARQRCTHNLT